MMSWFERELISVLHPVYYYCCLSFYLCYADFSTPLLFRRVF